MAETSGSGPVFVVGAGPSGLAAAHRLTAKGHPVVVLERRDRVGGQLLTVKQDGFLMETGATVLPEAYLAVMRLVDEIGMRGELIPSNSLMGFVRDRTLHLLRADNLALDAARTKLLSTRAKLQVGKLAIDALRIGKLLSYEDLSIASAYDRETPAAYAARRGISGELYDYLIEPTVRAGAGVPGDVISVVEFFFLWQKVLGTKLFAFRDGYTSFMQRLAAPLDVRLGVTVEEIVERPEDVEITWSGPDGQHTETGAGAIVSSMGNEVPDLLPQLESDRAAFLKNLRYTSCININVGLSRPPAGMPASFVVFPRPSSDALFAIIAEHNKAPGRTRPGKGLIGLYSMNEWAVEHADDDDDAVLAGLLRDAEPLMPGVTNDIEFVRVNRWYPVLVYSHPGLYRELGHFYATRRRGSRIHLAGSYNSSGNVNTAVAAGERAARELADALATASHRATAPSRRRVAGC